MKSIRQHYEELAETGRAELDRHANSMAVIGSYRNADAVMFAQDVETYGFTTAMHIAMDECTRAEHEKMGTPISHVEEYRATADRRRLSFRAQLRTEADYQGEMLHFLCYAVEEDEWLYGIPAKYDGFWTEVNTDANGELDVEFYKKPVVEPLGWQQG